MYPYHYVIAFKKYYSSALKYTPCANDVHVTKDNCSFLPVTTMHVHFPSDSFVIFFSLFNVIK